MLASTLRRPRCAMPMATSWMPVRAESARMWSSSGISDSPPSREKRFWPMNFVWRNSSKASARMRVPRMWRCASGEGASYGRSMRFWTHARCSGSWMCMYSMPTVRV